MAGSSRYGWIAWWAIAGLLVGGAGCRRDVPSSSVPQVAATNTYLASAVRDIAGPGLAVTCLAPPGMCPGHFDIRPSQVDELRRCRLLLRFDFQKSIDTQLRDVAADGLVIAEVVPPGSLCEPDSYVAACRRVAEALVEAGLAAPDDARRRLAAVEDLCAALAGDVRQEVRRAGLAARPVLCSSHQAGFCRAMGLRVAGTFSGGDAASVGQLDKAIQAGRAAGARWVVGNQPEGRAAADALAARLGATVVMFDNFPSIPAKDSTFETMVRGNVGRLIGAASHD